MIKKMISLIWLLQLFSMADAASSSTGSTSPVFNGKVTQLLDAQAADYLQIPTLNTAFNNFLGLNLNELKKFNPTGTQPQFEAVTDAKTMFDYLDGILKTKKNTLNFL